MGPRHNLLMRSCQEKKMSFSTVYVYPKRSSISWALRTTWYSVKSVVTDLIFRQLQNLVRRSGHFGKGALRSSRLDPPLQEPNSPWVLKALQHNRCLHHSIKNAEWECKKWAICCSLITQTSGLESRGCGSSSLYFGSCSWGKESSHSRKRLVQQTGKELLSFYQNSYFQQKITDIHMNFQSFHFWEPLLILNHFSKDSRSIFLNKGNALTLIQTSLCLHHHSSVIMQGIKKGECDYSVCCFFLTNQRRCEK